MKEPEVKIGTVIIINGQRGTVVRIEKNLGLIKWESGSTTVYNITGLLEYEILITV